VRVESVLGDFEDSKLPKSATGVKKPSTRSSLCSGESYHLPFSSFSAYIPFHLVEQGQQCCRSFLCKVNEYSVDEIF